MKRSAYAQWQQWRNETETADGTHSGAAAAALTREGAAAELPTCCVDLNRDLVLGLEGRDAHSFLQGYVTCDVESLAPDHALRGAFTDLKGRVITDCLLLELDGMPALILDRSAEPLLRESLKKYLMFARAELVDLSERYLLLGVLAPSGDDELPRPTAALETAALGEGRAIAEPGAVARLRCLLPPQAARALWQRYREAQRCGEDVPWRLTDIISGIAHIRAETAGQFLPQMLDLDRLDAISFTKGCYLGQEVVARAQHRGQVKRRLRFLRWRGPAAPAPGTELRDASGRGKATLLEAAAGAGGPGQREGLALAVMGVRDASERLEGADAVFTPQQAAQETR